MERATRPEVVFEMRWRPCEGIAGCEEFDGSTVFDDFGTFDDDQGYLLPLVPTGDRGRTRIDTVVEADGRALGGWRYPRYDGNGLCMVFPVTVGGGRAAFAVFHRLDGSPEEHRIYAGDLAAIRDVDTPIAVLGRDILGGGGAFQNLGVSEDMVVVLNGFGAILTSEGTRILAPLPGFPRPGFAGPLTVIGRDAFFSDWGGNGRAVHVSVDGEPELLVEIDGGDARGFVTDGRDMAWLQTRSAPEGGFESCELWTSAHTNVPASLAPRKVADMPEGQCSTGIVGAGYYAYGRRVNDDPYRAELVLVRLADGARLVLQFPEGHGVDPLYFSDTAVVSKRTRGDEFGVFRSNLDSATPE